MIKLSSILLIFIVWSPIVKAQKKAYDEVSAMKIYASMFEAERVNGQQVLPKGIMINNSTLKYFSEFTAPSGFKSLDSIISSPCWLYIKKDINQFISKNRQIGSKELINYFNKRPANIKTLDYFCDLSPVVFSEDMNRGCFIAWRSQNGVMVYFYQKKKLNWELIKAETLLLF